MQEYLKELIQKYAANLDRDINLEAQEYVKASGVVCQSGNAHACQLGAAQAHSNALLFTLKQAGLYVPSTIDPDVRELLDQTGRAAMDHTQPDGEPYPPELQ